MSTKVVVIGSGAVGGFIGSRMAKAGEDVTLIDMWPEHVDYLRAHGMQISGMTPQETDSIPVTAMHISDVQSLSKQRPVDVAFISTKAYDTAWAARLIAPYLAPNGFIVSAQNGINEETIAGVVGWGKTLGVIISEIGVTLYKPGHIKCTGPRGGAGYTVFRVGEVHNRVTPRAEEVARLLRGVDSARVTTNLWGQRWSKLIVNAMGSALAAVTGLSNNDRDTMELPRSISIHLGSETVRVGQALGYQLEEIAHMPPETLARAGEGDATAFAEISRIRTENAKVRSNEQRASMGVDMDKGRRTEAESINAYVARKGDETGVPAPLNAKMFALMNRVERGELAPGLDNVKDFLPR